MECPRILFADGRLIHAICQNVLEIGRAPCVSIDSMQIWNSGQCQKLLSCCIRSQNLNRNYSAKYLRHDSQKEAAFDPNTDKEIPLNKLRHSKDCSALIMVIKPQQQNRSTTIRTSIVFVHATVTTTIQYETFKSQ